MDVILVASLALLRVLVIQYRGGEDAERDPGKEDAI